MVGMVDYRTVLRSLLTHLLKDLASGDGECFVIKTHWIISHLNVMLIAMYIEKCKRQYYAPCMDRPL